MTQESLFDVTEQPELAAGTFRGGPLDGQRRPVPEHGPAWVRYFDSDGCHWYAWKKGSKRTYTHAGCN